MTPAPVTPPLAPGDPPRKVSFVRLPVALDAARLTEDLARLPSWIWERSHWPYPHGSVDVVLLRGGQGGGPAEYLVDDDITDHEHLASLPYLAWLVGPDGPFGGATFVFLFRMEPGGRSRLHTDDMPIWRWHHRVHVPITTNPGAHLVAGDRWLHLPVATAWTFDNQALHGALNGDTPRTHLILDVPATSPRMAALVAAGHVDPGAPLPPAAAHAVL